MDYEDFGPVVNPDGTPTEATLEILLGLNRKVGDTFNWYPDDSDYGTFVRIIAIAPDGLMVNYAVDPIKTDWKIPFNEAF
jgi:hypothetical protein